MCGLFVERRTWSRQQGARRGGGCATCFTSLKIRQKVIDFPMTYPTPQNTPLQSQTAGVVNMHHHLTFKHAPQTRSPTPHLGPGDHPLFPYLSLSLSLSLLTPPVSFMPLQSSCCPEN